MRTKNISSLLEQEESREYALKKMLGPSSLIALGTGAALGFGIFVLPGIVAIHYSGPFLPPSFILAALCCLLFGLSYAEFASAVPIAGSAYTYAYATVGEFFAWSVGWLLLLGYFIMTAISAKGWQAYFFATLKSLGSHSSVNNPMWNYIPAIFVVAALTSILLIGVRESAQANTFTVLVKIVALLVFIALGSSRLLQSTKSLSNLHSDGAWGIHGILAGAAILTLAYVGFDAVATAAEEAKNPRHDIPMGMLVSLTITAILYVLTGIVLVRLVGIQNLDVAAPLGEAAQQALGRFPAILINLGALTALTSSLLVFLRGLSRVTYSLARDGLLPPFFSELSVKYRTPFTTTIIAGVLTIPLTLLPLRKLAEIAAGATLAIFVSICIAVQWLRYKRPDLPKAFKVWTPLIPLGGAITGGVLIAALPVLSLLQIAIWQVAGLIVYFSYGYRKSTLASH